MIALKRLICWRDVLSMGHVLRVCLRSVGKFLNLHQIWRTLKVLGLHFTKVRKVFKRQNIIWMQFTNLVLSSNL